MSSLTGITASDTTQMNIKSMAADTAVIRRLPAEIAALQKTLIGFSATFKDDLTMKIADWANRFNNEIAAKKTDPAQLLKKYIAEIHELIREPSFYGQSLDENAWLGSDGFVYTSYTYGIFRGGIKEEFRNRSPFKFEEDSTPVTVRPYKPIIKPILDWLKSHHEAPLYTVSDETKLLYEQLRKENKIHAPATIESLAETVSRATAAAPAFKSMSERMRQYLAEQAEDKQKDIEIKAHIDARSIMEPTAIKAGLAQDEMKENNEGLLNRVIIVESKLKEEVEEVGKEIQDLSERANVLHANLDAHEQRQAKTDATIDKVDQQQINLRAQLAEIQRKIKEKEKKKKRLKKIITIVAIAGVCIFATWALYGVMQSSGFSAMVVPIKGGGAKLWLFAATS